MFWHAFTAYFIISLLPKPYTMQEQSVNDKLELVFSDDTYQLTGVAVSKDGRMFTCYPLWPGPHKWDVVEIIGPDECKPYPDEK
jgi:hypothetical protein